LIVKLLRNEHLRVIAGLPSLQAFILLS